MEGRMRERQKRTLSPTRGAGRQQAYDEAEREEVIANIRNFGDFAHPDDPPARNLYLKQRYAGTGLTAFLRRIEGKPPRRFPPLG